MAVTVPVAASVASLVILAALTPYTVRAGVAHTHNHSHKSGQKERMEDGAYSPRDASHVHSSSDSHESAFDHEVILGSRSVAEEFDSLSSSEAKRRLEQLLLKMDRDDDKLISKKELHSWILRSFRSLSQEESAERFKDADQDGDGHVTWTEYKAEEFDLENDDDDVKIKTDPDRLDELNMLEEDRTLFIAADTDGDEKLDAAEFLSFSHPEEDPRMHDTVINQVLKDKDKNGDGFIDFQEYIGERAKDQTKEWLVSEKDRFDKDLDRDRDGLLGRADILAWLIPSNEDIAEDEVNHLFAGSDDDVDGVLSFKEVLDHHELFVGSEATDYGEHLQNLHKFTDEL